MILEITLESVFAIVDMYFVSRLGATAIATVGLTEAAVTIIYSIAIGLSTGAGAIVARRVGEKDPDGAAHAAGQAIVASSTLSIVLAILGIIYGREILALMGASEDVLTHGETFTKIMLSATPAIVLLFLLNGIFRGVGDAAMAMRSLWLASGVNIVLCPILINQFGLNGAAYATCIGRTSGVLYQLWHLRRGRQSLPLAFKHLLPDFTLIKSIITIASPATLQFIIGSGSWIVITRMIAELGGTEASAGYQIAFRCFIFFILPAWGLSNAAATLVGQNLGAKAPERAEQSVWSAVNYSAVLMGLVTILFLAAPHWLTHFFTSDPIVTGHSVRGLMIVGAGNIFYGVSMVLTQALNGAGDSKTPTWLNVIAFWLFQIPLAYLLVYVLKLPFEYAVVSVPIAHGVLTVLAWWYFKQDKWKQVTV
jgi:putative MATE family efflux protein